MRPPLIENISYIIWKVSTVLSIHTVVKYMTEHLKNLQDFDVTIDVIDENGNIEITITEHKKGMF